MPEDSSNHGTKKEVFHSDPQNTNRIVHSVVKVLVCYAMALAVTVILSRLH